MGDLLIPLLLFVARAYTGSVEYEQPARKALEAAYAGSSVRGYVRQMEGKLRTAAPAATLIVPIAYRIGTKREVVGAFRVGDTTVSLSGNEGGGFVRLSWGF